MCVIAHKSLPAYPHPCVQAQPVEQDQFPGQDPGMMMDQKPPMYGQQQYASSPANMQQAGYTPMQDANFHGLQGQMGQRPGYPMLRMQARPGLRPGGVVPNQPNTLRLQLQHRLQAQQVHTHASLKKVEQKWLFYYLFISTT